MTQDFALLVLPFDYVKPTDSGVVPQIKLVKQSVSKNDEFGLAEVMQRSDLHDTIYIVSSDLQHTLMRTLLMLGSKIVFVYFVYLQR